MSNAQLSTVQPTAQDASAYRSYLVRFWQSSEQGQWRASAQCVQTGNTLLFGDIPSLLIFLNTEFVTPVEIETAIPAPLQPSAETRMSDYR